MRFSMRFAALVGVSALAVGLTACTLFESEELEPETPADQTEPEPTGDQTEAASEFPVGAWVEDVEMLGGTLEIDSDGYLYLQQEGGPAECDLVQGSEEGIWECDLIMAMDGIDPELAGNGSWEMTYDAETDTVHAVHTWSDGTRHERDFVPGA